MGGELGQASCFPKNLRSENVLVSVLRGEREGRKEKGDSDLVSRSFICFYISLVGLKLLL